MDSPPSPTGVKEDLLANIKVIIFPSARELESIAFPRKRYPKY
jgi:hypothetical protein